MSEPARNRFALDLDDLERQLRGAGAGAESGQPRRSAGRADAHRRPGRSAEGHLRHRGQAARPSARAARPARHPSRAPAQSRQEPSSLRRRRCRRLPSSRSAGRTARCARRVRGAAAPHGLPGRRPPAEPRGPAPAQAEPHSPSRTMSSSCPSRKPYQRAAAGQALAPAHAISTRSARRTLSRYDDAGALSTRSRIGSCRPIEDDAGSGAAPLAQGALAAAAADRGRRHRRRRRDVACAARDGRRRPAAGDRRRYAGRPRSSRPIPAEPRSRIRTSRSTSAPARPRPGQTKVVSREEQPVDVQQAARSMPAAASCRPGPAPP